MKKMGRPKKAEGRFRHVSINVEPELADEIEAAALADGGRPVSAFGRLLLTAAWRTFKMKGDKGDAWLREFGTAWVVGAEAAKSHRVARA